jgi:hypothetical protein
MDIHTISPELITTAFPEGVDLLLASPTLLARHLPRSHSVHTPMGPDGVRIILHLIMHLSEAQPEGGRLNLELFRALSSLCKHLVTSGPRHSARSLEMWLGSLPQHTRLVEPYAP